MSDFQQKIRKHAKKTKQPPPQNKKQKTNKQLNVARTTQEEIKRIETL